MSEPWDQLESEPDAAYKRFLLYRNLGPSRTMDRAYRAQGKRLKRGKTKRAPPNWYEDSQKFDWRRRAHAWDLQMLHLAGEEAVVAMVENAKEGASKTLQGILDAPVPTDWGKIVENLRALAGIIPAEAVAALQCRLAAGASGSGGAGAPGPGVVPGQPGGERPPDPAGGPVGETGGDRGSGPESPVQGSGEERS